MKTLQLSTIVLLLSCAFFSCTKDFPASTEPGSVPLGNGEQAIADVIDFTVDPNPAYLSSTIKVSGTLQFNKPVNKFNYSVQISTTEDGTNADGSIKWIDFQDINDIVDPDIEESSEHIDLGSTGEGRNRRLVTATTFPFEFEVPASEIGLGKTGWRIHVNGGDAENVWIGDETLEIVESCVETFTIGHDVDARNIGDGNYEFTITYTLKSPDDVENIHFQGGATSGGQFQHVLVEGSLKGGLQVRHDNKQNTVLFYDGPLTKCEPLELSFKYIRKFSCPAEAATVTGQWTATAVGMEPYIVAPLTYSCNPDGTKK